MTFPHIPFSITVSLLVLAAFLLSMTGCRSAGETSDPGQGTSEPAVPSGSLPDAYSLFEPETPLTAELGNGLSVHFPAGWKELPSQTGGREWSNREMTVFLSADSVSLDSVKGLTGDVILEGVRREVEESYPASAGYSIDVETLSLPFGTAPALNVSRAGDLFRQQISLVFPESVCVLTVSAPGRAEAQAVWSCLTAEPK